MAAPPQTPNTWPGHATADEGLRKAFERAYDNAKADGKGPDWYHVVSIHVRFENPLSEYRVVIGGGG